MVEWVHLMSDHAIQNILLIDDDAWFSRALTQVLVLHGYTVNVFSDGKQALEWLAGRRVDLVMTDVYMEGMDGLEIIRAVRKSCPAVKIIAMSGGSQVVDLDWLSLTKMLGADLALGKPIEAAELLKAIDDLGAGSAPVPTSDN